MRSYPITFSFLAAIFAELSHQTEAAKCGDFFYNACSNSKSDPRYDPDASNNLNDQDPIYKKLEGFWIGEYVFYDGSGDVMPPSLYDETYGFGWPYDYSSYRGAINITVDGSRYMQHNYFFYPPASVEFCEANANPAPGKVNAYGSGICGVNGGFKSFDAFGTSSHEKDGTMISLPGAGTYANFVNINRPIDTNTMLYTSTDNSTQFHSQINVFYPDENHRTRTAYGFDYNMPGQNSALMYSSLYKEVKVTEEEFLQALQDYGPLYNVPTNDIASFPMEETCLRGNWAGGVGAVCPTEESFCEIDPNCTESPYKPEEPTLNAGVVSGFVAAAAIILIIALIFYSRAKVESARRSVRSKFSKVLMNSSDWNSSHSPQSLLKVFNKIDLDESGLISKSELHEFVKVNDGLSEKEFQLLFESVDKDNSNEIDFAEFCAFYTHPSMTSRNGTEKFHDDSHSA